MTGPVERVGGWLVGVGELGVSKERLVLYHTLWVSSARPPLGFLNSLAATNDFRKLAHIPQRGEGRG